MRHLLVISLLSLSACQKNADDVQFELVTVDQIEFKVITLAPNTEYILRLPDQNSQRFIVYIGEGDAFSFAKLSDIPEDPTNWPISITGSGNIIQTTRQFVSDDATILITDDDGDGFPDTRTHVHGTLGNRDLSRPVKNEKVTHSFEKIEPEGRSPTAAQQNANEQPTTRPESK